MYKKPFARRAARKRLSWFQFIKLISEQRPNEKINGSWYVLFSVFFGGFLASAKTHKRAAHSSAKLFIVLGMVLATCACLLFFAVGRAQGSGEVDSSTIGIGQNQSSQSSMDSATRISSVSDSQTSSHDISEAVDATQSAQRSITVNDPDPVVVPIAVDTSNPVAVEKASQVCTLDPLPTAPHVAPDVNDGTWMSGPATAYNITSNDDGFGNFGVDITASGIALTSSSVTVAVPASKSYLLGSIVEICYDGKVVIATVTDTGGFESYGRVLDLAPGVYKAFGCATPEDWGVRNISYRFI